MIEHPEDPYGEEEWDDTNESYQATSTEGVIVNINTISRKFYRSYSDREDREYEKELREIFLNKLVEFRGIVPNRNEVTVTDTIVDLSVNGSQVTVTITNGKKYYLMYVENTIKILDPSYAEEVERHKKEKQRRIEELKLKMMDVDPYGEEEWEND